MPEEENVTTEVVEKVVDPVVEVKETTIPEETTKVEEVKETPEVKEPETKETEDIDGLKAEIAKLQGELATAMENSNSKVELDQAKTLLNVQKNLVSEYEGILNGIVDMKLQEIPENLKELVPSNLGLKEKLDWIAKAEKTGIFKPVTPDIEIGKPLNPTSSKQTTDTSKLSASTLMSMAYGSSKGRNNR